MRLPTSLNEAMRPEVQPAHSALPLEVVVVDDDEHMRELVAERVISYGHRCRVAVDGVHALRLLDEAPADVVVSDWDMPNIDGAELCRRVRSGGDDAPYTYFILMTAFDDRVHLFDGMAAGADDYQRKPVNVHELEARLVSASRVVELHRRLEMRTAKLRVDSTRNFLASRTDALTGIGNRMHLDEEIATLLSRAERYGTTCSLALCDIDLFKAYNDCFGHIQGDEALRAVAGAMRSNLRAVDALFRYGGEEFVVLLFEQPLADAEHAMERMRAQVAKLGIPAADGGHVTMSIGVAELDVARDRSAATWIARADAALYEAKARGRNRVITSVPPRA
jgi:two-component system, cell cycle response regulator